MPFARSDVHELLAAEPSCRLPRGVQILDVAEACRRAALDFVSDGPDGATSKRALSAWLGGQYLTLVTLVDEDAKRAPVRAGEVTEMPAFARAYVLATMRGIARSPSEVGFTIAAMHDGWIERCCDGAGRPGWLPVDRPNMRLSERVLSLVAVDYLVRPRDWLDGRLLRAAAKIAV